MKNQSLPTKLFITRTCCILALLGLQWSCEGNLSGDSKNIYALAKIEFVDPSCTDLSECFGKVFKCYQSQKENLYLKVDFIPFTEHVMLNGLTNTFNLTYDRTVPHFSVYQTQQKEDISLTEVITDTVFYHRESTFPRQFKTISEFYGTLEGVSYEDKYYIRAVAQFVGCYQIRLNGFIRSGDALFQIRPAFDLLESVDPSKNLLDLQYYHEIVRYTSILATGNHIFTLNSLAIQNAIKFDSNFLKLKSVDKNEYDRKRPEIENRYCLIHMIVDKSFYQKMNSNTQKTVAYVQLAFMMANEIFKNSKWTNMEYGLIGFALKKIDIDLTFGNEYANFTRATFEKAFDKVDTEIKEQSCLVHLLTAKNVTSSDHDHHNDEAILHGINLVNGIFTRHNTGGTTVANCSRNPWDIECLVAFAHQLAHAMGATDDDAKDEKHLSDKKAIDQQMIISKNLILSNKSIREIVDKSLDPHEIKLFIPATDWSRCGNSIVEQGEQCDEGDTHLCCDSNCQFIKNANCSPINSLCCTEKCQLKQSNPCIPWSYFPDKSHYCQNKAAYCRPENIVVDCFDHHHQKTGQSVNEEGNNLNNDDRNNLFIPYAVLFLCLFCICLFLRNRYEAMKKNLNISVKSPFSNKIQNEIEMEQLIELKFDSYSRQNMNNNYNNNNGNYVEFNNQASTNQNHRLNNVVIIDEKKYIPKQIIFSNAVRLGDFDLSVDSSRKLNKKRDSIDSIEANSVFKRKKN